MCRLPDDGHSDQCEVMPHCSFDLHVSNNYTEHLFIEFVGHLYVFFGEMSVYFFCLVFNWVVCYVDIEQHELFVYFGDYPLSVASFANLFSHSEGCIFVWFMVFFAVQKLLSLIRSCLFIFLSTFITLGGGSRSCCDLCQNVLPVFSSKNFTVSELTFRYLIHFELLFLYGVKECSNFILLHVAIQFSQHLLSKSLSLLHSIFLPPL